MRIFKVSDQKRIALGRQGENKAVQILWPGIAAEYRSLYGDGEFQLMVKRFGDKLPYSADIEVLGADISWIVTETETYREGGGSCELRYLVNDVLAKSQVWQTGVEPSLTGTASVPPSEYPLVEQILKAKNEAVKAAEDAERAAKSVQQAVPPGGETGQVLTKESKRDYDSSWKTPTGGGSDLQSPDIDRILVMDKAEYDALPLKDPRTLYLIRG